MERLQKFVENIEVITMAKWFNVGKIVNTHGVRGEVRVISRTDFPDERYKKGKTLFLFKNEHEEPIPLTVQAHRKHKNFDLLMFEGYENIGVVEGFKEGILKVSEEELGELTEGEFYFHEIIGCHVYTTSGDEIGSIKEILTPGANDVWVIKAKQGKDILIPYIEQIVKDVNIDEKKVIIEPMEGLLS